LRRFHAFLKTLEYVPIRITTKKSNNRLSCVVPHHLCRPGTAPDEHVSGCTHGRSSLSLVLSALGLPLGSARSFDCWRVTLATLSA
jgi:hypothetical protein